MNAGFDFRLNKLAGLPAGRKVDGVKITAASIIALFLDLIAAHVITCASPAKVNRILTAGQLFDMGLQLNASVIGMRDAGR
jgi:hypothetical protein